MNISRLVDSWSTAGGDKLTEQHINQRTKQVELRKRIHSLEQQVAIMQQALMQEGIMDIDDAE